MTHVLVTGGSGFIGSHLVERLVEDGHDVDVVDDFSNSRNENIALVYKTATNVWQVDASRHPFLTELDGYDVVVHLLCFPRSLSFDFVERSVQVNLIATLRVLELAERSRAKFIFASNSGLYDVVSGRLSHLPRSATWDAIDEQWPDKPTSPYDIHKQASEHHVRLSPAKHTILRFPCYDEKTRLLTKDGLKTFPELREQQTVFSINPVSGCIEEAKTRRVWAYPYAAELIAIKTQTTDLLVTPNHRLLLSDGTFQTAQERYGKFTKLVAPHGSWVKGFKTTEIDLYRFFDQRTLKWNARRLPTKLTIQEFFYMAGLFIGDGYISHSCYTRASKGLTREEVIANRDEHGRFARVYADGGTTTCHSFKVMFVLLKGTLGRQRLMALLRKIGIPFWKTGDGYEVGITSRLLYETFKQFGRRAKEKHIPRWMKGYNSDALYCLLEGIADSDGSRDTENTLRVNTVSERLASDLVEMAVKLGRYANVSNTPPRTSILAKRFGGGTIQSGKGYLVYIQKPKRSKTVRREQFSRVPYSGVVWCVEAPPHGNVLVERNGKFVFSGNSVYGPRQNHTEGWRPVIIEFFLKALQGKQPTIYGDGSVTRDFTYVSDIVDALMLSMKGGNGETLVLGTGVETSILDLWHKIAELTGCELDPIFEPEKSGDIKWMRYDASKAERILGWKPKTPLETGLRRVKEYLTKG